MGYISNSHPQMRVWAPRVKARGFFIAMPKKVSFFIDGFNLYYSICDAIESGRITHGKWLDLRSLCSNYLHLFGHDATLQNVHYFSAFMFHAKDPQTPKRHDELIRALRETGVTVVMGKFKKKQVKCRARCKRMGWGR